VGKVGTTKEGRCIREVTGERKSKRRERRAGRGLMTRGGGKKGKENNPKKKTKGSGSGSLATRNAGVGTRSPTSQRKPSKET